eukprot:6460438-Amphidinium_carterae.1
MLLGDSGCDEVHYVFLDESEPYKRGTLRTSVATNLKEVSLQNSNVLWEGQGQKYFEMHAKQSHEHTGLQAYLAREASGHLSLMSVKSWLSTVSDGGDVPDDATTEVQAAQSISGLSGVAAAAFVETPQKPFFGKTGKPTPPSKPNSVVSALARAGSAVSLAGGSEAGSAMAGNAAGNDGDSITVADGDEGCSFCKHYLHPSEKYTELVMPRP